MSEGKLVKFGVQIEKLWEEQWSFGINLSHWGDETYLYITIFKRSVTIGRFYKDED